MQQDAKTRQLEGPFVNVLVQHEFALRRYLHRAFVLEVNAQVRTMQQMENINRTVPIAGGQKLACMH